MRLFRWSSVRRFATAVTLVAASAFTCAHAEDIRLGSWQLVKRTLPDGTVLTPPAVGGMFSVTPTGVYHLHVFWKTPEGKPASRSSIVEFKYSETELAATQLFGSFDDGSGKPLVYDREGETKRVPIKRDGNKISYQHPFDPPYNVIDGDTLIATLKDVFVDTWERIK